MEWPAPLTVSELAAELDCSVDEVRGLIRAGELSTVACGIRPGRVPRHEVDAYLRRLAARNRPLGGSSMGLEDDAPIARSGDTRSMTNDDLRLLQAAGTESVVPAGQMLIERGQIGTGLFVILEGSVIVEAPEGVRELGPGAVVGERALASSDGKRTARVRTTTDVRVLAVPRAEVDRLTKEHSSLAERIAAAAA